MGAHAADARTERKRAQEQTAAEALQAQLHDLYLRLPEHVEHVGLEAAVARLFWDARACWSGYRSASATARSSND